MEFKLEKTLHFFLMGTMIGIAIVSIAFVYLSSNGVLQEQPIPSELVSAEEAGNTKPLPGYMLETLKPDELEQLKP